MVYCYPTNQAFIVPAHIKLNKKSNESVENKKIRDMLRANTLKTEKGNYIFKIK